MTKKERIEILEQIADFTADLLFCDDENEQDFCGEVLCRKLKELGYVGQENEKYYATDKSTAYKDFLEERKVRNDKL